jgi:uncharacterized protein (DUF2062 family)
MVRRVFKKKRTQKSKLDSFIEKYKIPREYLSVNRRSITKGLAIGIFFGLIPMPFQMLAVLAMTPFIKFNFPIAISAVWLSNPITMPFMYYIEYETGVFLLGLDPLGVELSMQWFENNLDKIFFPLYAGTLFYCVTIAPLIYFVVNWLWIHSVKKDNNIRKKR